MTWRYHLIFAEYLVARGATRAHWRIRRRRRTWALRVMRADATAVGRPTTFCFELCGRSDTSRALPQSSDAPPRPSTNVRASVPARARGSVRRRPRNHGPITHLPRRQAETAPPLNATYSSFDSHDSWPRAGHVGALLASTCLSVIVLRPLPPLAPLAPRDGRRSGTLQRSGHVYTQVAAPHRWLGAA